MTPTFFLFGAGFSARAAAQACRVRFGPGIEIYGTTRRPDNFAALEAAGITPIAFDGRRPEPQIAAALAKTTHLIASIAPTPAGDPALVHHAADLASAPHLQWIGYFSTIGVYGNADGGWLDETAPPAPHNERLRHRVAAEAAWSGFAAGRGLPLAILRLAGIYGPGRSAFDKLRDGTARRIVKPGQVFNRIHVEDIGRITALAAETRLDGIFNLADDAPAPPQDLIAYAAGRLGLPPPPEIPFETADLSPMARSFYEGNRRISNAAIKKALGIDLLYPDYRAGLDAILAGETR